MAIYRNKQTKDFSTLPNALLQNKTLSYKARGLLAYLLSKPLHWAVQPTDLCTPTDGASAIRHALRELREAGYIRWEQVRTPGGKFVRYEYNVYDTPHAPETPYVENRHTAQNEPCSENRHTANYQSNQQDEENLPRNILSQNEPYGEKPYTEKPYTENRTPYKRQILEKTEKRERQYSANAEYFPEPDRAASGTPLARAPLSQQKRPPRKPPPPTDGHDWPADEKPLYDWLATQDLLTTLTVPLDHAWWAEVSWIIGWPETPMLAREFAKMQLWLRENPQRTPTPRGTSRFIRGWLERTYEKERRHAKE